MKVNWLDSVFSDGTQLFVNNKEPKLGDMVTVSMRVYKDSPVEKVWVSISKNGANRNEKASLLREDERFFYYGYTFQMKQPRVQYQFVIYAEGKLYYYAQDGIHTTPMDRIHDFVILADYHQPSWVKDSVFYQIFPERFCNGDPSLNVQPGEYKVNGYDTFTVEEWETPAGPYDQCHCCDFYGGDLVGIKQKIPYLKKLGVNAIYLNPIFRAPSVHKYDCIDYLHVDPHFGGDEALAELSKALHNEGMKLIVDISINHTGTAHRWFNKDLLYFDKSVGAYYNPENKERDYYVIHEDGSYECWDDVPELPKLNFCSDALRDALYRDEDSVIKKWLKPPYSIDGWRFDVADVMANYDEHQLADEVWPEIRTAIREENEDAYILAEHWDDCVKYLQGDCWDATMNYNAFGRLIRQFYGLPDVFTEREPELWPCTYGLTAEDFRTRVESYLARLPFPFWQNQYNLFNSHDVGRLQAYPGVTKKKWHGAILALFTMIGVPSVYYGDELDIEGQIGFFEGARYPMPWSREAEEGDTYLLHQKLAALRKSEPALREGSFKFLYAKDDVIAYARFNDKDCFVTVLSASEKDQIIALDTESIGFSVTEEFETDEEQRLLLRVPKEESLLIHLSC